MPTYTPTRLAQAQPGTSYGTLYTSPAATATIVKEILVSNTTGSSVALDVSFVPSAGSAGATNAIITNAIIPAYQTVIFTFSQVLATGGFISAKASVASSLTLTVSGVTFGDATPAAPDTAWTAYGATLTATTTNPVLGTGGGITGRYQRFGRLIIGSVDWKFGTSGITIGSGTYRISLPVLPITPPWGTEASVASGYIRDLSAAVSTSRLPVVGWQVAGLQLLEMAEGYGKNLVTEAIPYTWAITDEGHLDFNYEAAA